MCKGPERAGTGTEAWTMEGGASRETPRQLGLER